MGNPTHGEGQITVTFDKAVDNATVTKFTEDVNNGYYVIKARKDWIDPTVVVIDVDFDDTKFFGYDEEQFIRQYIVDHIPEDVPVTFEGEITGYTDGAVWRKAVITTGDNGPEVETQKATITFPDGTTATPDGW